MLAVVLAGCRPAPTTPEAASAEAEIAAQPEAFQIPTAIPLPTAEISRPAPLPHPTEEPESQPAADLQAETSPSLLDLEPGDQLELVAELPIPRVDFGVRLAFSPNGSMLLHSGIGLTIQRFDLLRLQPAGELTGFELNSPLTISMSPDGSAVAADDGAQVRVWDNQSGQLLNALPLPPISALANAGFYQDQLYYTVDFHGNVLIWDPQSWGQLTQFSYPGRIESAVLYPDGSAIALQDRDRNEISVYDTEGNLLRSVTFEGTYAELLSVSPDGERFLLHLNYGLPSEGVAVISAHTGQQESSLELLNFRNFAVSSDWELLAAVGVANELRLYSLPEAELLLSQQLGVRRTMSLQMSPAAHYLAVFAIKEPGQGGSIQVWGPGPDA